MLLFVAFLLQKLNLENELQRLNRVIQMEFESKIEGQSIVPGMGMQVEFSGTYIRKNYKVQVIDLNMKMAQMNYFCLTKYDGETIWQINSFSQGGKRNVIKGSIESFSKSQICLDNFLGPNKVDWRECNYVDGMVRVIGKFTSQNDKNVWISFTSENIWPLKIEVYDSSVSETGPELSFTLSEPQALGDRKKEFFEFSALEGDHVVDFDEMVQKAKNQ